MIIVRLISGLGNQLFQYAIARQLALKNNTNLKLDISFFDNQNLRCFELENFKISATLAGKDDIEKFKKNNTSLTIKQKIHRRINQFLPKHKQSYFSEDGLWLYDKNIYKIKNPIYLEGYWQNINYYKNLDERIINELSIRNAEDIRYSVYLNNIEIGSSVSIHIRRGDYLTDINAYNMLGVLPIKYYQKAIEYIKLKVTEPNFYVFSDDLEWAKKHLSINATYVEIENGTLPHFELSLMSKCKHNIIANSSFSWWGAFLNRNEDKIVIMPKNWVRDHQTNEKINLKFPSWIQL